MGIITKLNIDYIKSKIKEYYNINIKYIQPTKNGISDTTYLIKNTNTNYILKIYEYSIPEKVNKEIDLLKILRKEGLNVPRIIKQYNNTELCYIDNKPSVLFTYLNGKTLNKPNKANIKKVALFLAKLHSITYTSNINNIYTVDRIKYYLNKANYKSIMNCIDSLNILYSPYGLIHGDLFMDNVTFNKQGLGVFDFSSSCYGQLYFDIAVVVISWCFLDSNLNKILLDTLISTYNDALPLRSISFNALIEWMRFACLYYGAQRIYMRKVRKQTILSEYDIKEYINKFYIISKIN